MHLSLEDVSDGAELRVAEKYHNFKTNRLSHNFQHTVQMILILILYRYCNFCSFSKLQMKSILLNSQGSFGRSFSVDSNRVKPVDRII